MTPHPTGAQSLQTTAKVDLVRQNLRVVKQLYPWIHRTDLSALRELTMALRLSVSEARCYSLTVNGTSLTLACSE
jgi:hypothetical protein